jgi:hypothetical protein
MKSFLRLAAITLASTALVAGNATSSTAAPSASSVEAPAPVATSAAPVSAAAMPYPLDYKTKLRATKRGKKITFRVTARYRDDNGTAVGIRRATIQVKKGGKWRTLKNVKLKASGTGTYKRSDRKKRNYRLIIKGTSVYQSGRTGHFKI